MQYVPQALYPAQTNTPGDFDRTNADINRKQEAAKRADELVEQLLEFPDSVTSNGPGKEMTEPGKGINRIRNGF